VGGLAGRTADGWLDIESLVVPATLRGQGLGAQIMAQAEAQALRRGCHSAWLGTLDFQARGFYERLRYECFGDLPNHPPGHRLFFMRKTLNAVFSN
jgi:GNAT superfamily N-acetyltransferase